MEKNKKVLALTELLEKYSGKKVELIKEDYIGKAGIRKVQAALHQKVDKYISIINPMSEQADIEFFVKDFYQWVRNGEEIPTDNYNKAAGLPKRF